MRMFGARIHFEFAVLRASKTAMGWIIANIVIGLLGSLGYVILMVLATLAE